MSTRAGLTVAELAEVLFASSLQESEQADPARVREVIAGTLSRCRGDCSVCLETVAQEAGDHPEEYARRMRWALRTVRHAYPRAGLPPAC